MSVAVRMHEDEVLPDEALVRRLLAGQFPEWAELPLARVPSDGTDNALFRLGGELAVRLPRIDWAVAARAAEHEWLPFLAGHLPVEIPEPVALGGPAEGYPWPWSVYRWLEGERPAAGAFGDLDGLVRFLRALRAVWDAASAAPEWDGPPVWVHGDLMPGNLLVREGRLAAAIDWGGLGVGDPACDLMVAWTLLGPQQRVGFRTALVVDEATWDRARGWALVTALNAIPYYRHTNPGLVANARYRLEQLLEEVDP